MSCLVFVGRNIIRNSFVVSKGRAKNEELLCEVLYKNSVFTSRLLVFLFLGALVQLETKCSYITCYNCRIGK